MNKKTNFKRLMAMLVTFVMILSFVPVALAAETVQLTATSDKMVVQRGDTVKISVGISANSNVSAMNVELNYDTEVVEYVEGDVGVDGSADGGMAQYANNLSKGKAKYGYINATTGRKTGGELFYATFKVKETATGQLPITLRSTTFKAADGTIIPNESTNPSVNVSMPLESVTVTPDVLTLNEGTSDQLAVTYHPEETSVDKTVTWTSSNEAVASVKAGLVTGVSAGTATITATVLDKTATCAVTVNKVVATSIAMKTLPTKLNYIEGETLDITGGKLDVTMSDETVLEVDLKPEMCTVDMNKTGEQMVTVSYGGQQTHFNIQMTQKSLTGIAMEKNPAQVEYTLGEQKTLDVTGGKVKLIYDNGRSETIDLTDAMCSAVDLETVGAKTVTVTYEGKTTTFDLKVIKKALTDIKIKTKPAKVIYVVGEKFDVTGGKVDLIYNNNTTEIIDLTPEMCSAVDMKKVGPQEVTVTYNKKETTFSIMINAVASDNDHKPSEPTKPGDQIKPDYQTKPNETTGNSGKNPGTAIFEHVQNNRGIYVSLVICALGAIGVVSYRRKQRG
ncbi:MAG: bacterial Ig-like domain-containing protein [Eubacterium sp.]